MTKKIVILGSSRVSNRDTLYQRTTRATKELLNSGFEVYTSGFKGLAKAAQEADQDAVYDSILLRPNEYQGYLVLPGGYGTLSKFAQVVTWKQQYKLYCPIIIVGPMMRDIASSVSRTLLRNAYIDNRDLDLWNYAQTPEAGAVKLIEAIK